MKHRDVPYNNANCIIQTCGENNTKLVVSDEKGRETTIGTFKSYQEAEDILIAITKTYVGILRNAALMSKDISYELAALYLTNLYL